MVKVAWLLVVFPFAFLQGCGTTTTTDATTTTSTATSLAVTDCSLKSGKGSVIACKEDEMPDLSKPMADKCKAMQWVMDCTNSGGCCTADHTHLSNKKGSYDTKLDKATNPKWTDCVGLGVGEKDVQLIDPCHDCTDKTVMDACTKLTW